MGAIVLIGTATIIVHFVAATAAATNPGNNM
jgi:hypothetical protein